MADKLLFFLVKGRCGQAFQFLSYAFSEPTTILEDSFDFILPRFVEHIVPRLFEFESHAVVCAGIPPESLKYHPDVLLAADATLVNSMAPENFMKNKLMYSSYKKKPGFQFTVGIATGPYLVCSFPFASLTALFSCFP